MKLILTVDTEADNQWDVGAELTTDNLGYVPRFQALCEHFEFPPTYLCTYEVVTSAVFDGTLGQPARNGHAEIGAHLHPWSTPPFDAVWDDADRGHPYPSELPTELFQSKLRTLTATLSDRLGQAPTSYRAGRWGFSAAQVAPMVRLGYLVDCSITPLVSWVGDLGLREGGHRSPPTVSHRGMCAKPGTLDSWKCQSLSCIPACSCGDHAWPAQCSVAIDNRSPCGRLIDSFDLHLSGFARIRECPRSA